MIDDSPIIIRSKEMSSKERLSISVEILAGRNFFLIVLPLQIPQNSHPPKITKLFRKSFNFASHNPFLDFTYSAKFGLRYSAGRSGFDQVCYWPVCCPFFAGLPIPCPLLPIPCPMLPILCPLFPILILCLHICIPTMHSLIILTT